MTGTAISAKPHGVPRPKTDLNEVQMPFRVPATLAARIQAVLWPTESRAEFLRATIEHEVRRREAALKRKG